MGLEYTALSLYTNKFVAGLLLQPVIALNLKVKLGILLTILLAVIAARPAQDFPDVCQEPGNVLPNCNFDNGMAGWQPYFEEGNAFVEVQQGGGECHAPLCPAVHIVTESHFVGGIFQQAPVVKGNTYYANIVWLAFDSLVNDPAVNSATGGVGRQIGIDPFGGTDSRSPNVIWSPPNRRNDCKICNVEQVTATAQADVITVFIKIDDTWRLRAAEQGYNIPPSKDQFWLDDIGMKQVNGSQAPAVAATEPPPTGTPPPPPPTDTPLPPTDTPESEPPTPSPTPLPEDETGPAQANSPVATPAPANTVAPLPTLTPTQTPTVTPTLERRPTPTPRPPRRIEPASSGASFFTAGTLGVVGTTACFGGLILLAMAAMITGLVWLYRLGWGNPAENEDDFDDFDDDEEITVDLVE